MMINGMSFSCGRHIAIAIVNVELTIPPSQE